MTGTAIPLTVWHSTGRTTFLQTKIPATQYGPVAVFGAGSEGVCVAHVASGRVLLTVPDRVAARAAIEFLLSRVTTWRCTFDRGNVVFDPSLDTAIAQLRA